MTKTWTRVETCHTCHQRRRCTVSSLGQEGYDYWRCSKGHTWTRGPGGLEAMGVMFESLLKRNVLMELCD